MLFALADLRVAQNKSEEDMKSSQLRETSRREGGIHFGVRVDLEQLTVPVSDPGFRSQLAWSPPASLGLLSL